VVIAAAGSGKTEYLLNAAISEPHKRVLIVTYTNENLREINSRLWAKLGGPAPNVTTMTWFEFMLRDGVKPYQSYKTTIGRIRSINFIKSKAPRFTERSDFERYYLDRSDNIYSDAVSDLACVLNELSKGKVIGRIEAIYDKILIDEFQDLAGYDLDFLDLLLASRVEVVMVGDPRQTVYLTNRSNRHKQFRGARLVNWVGVRADKGVCTSITLSVSYRCNQAICDFADSIYPSMPATASANHEQVPHMGVFLVNPADVDRYRRIYSPQELRWDRRSPAGPGARNFGEVKGLSFSRVLIYPTKTIVDYIEKGIPLKDVTAAKFYVAVTRARHSVGIVMKTRSTNSTLEVWTSADADAI
jgi:hypothetical protein